MIVLDGHMVVLTQWDKMGCVKRNVINTKKIEYLALNTEVAM